MKITRPAIEQALSSISLPGAGKNLIEANARWKGKQLKDYTLSPGMYLCPIAKPLF